MRDRCPFTIRGKQGNFEYELQCDLRENHNHPEHVHHCMFDTVIDGKKTEAAGQVTWEVKK